MTRNGFLAGISPDDLKLALEYQNTGSRAKLDTLIRSGRVIRMDGRVKVHVIERSVELRMMKIQFPDRKPPYWVMDGSLERIEGGK